MSHCDKEGLIHLTYVTAENYILNPVMGCYRCGVKHLQPVSWRSPAIAIGWGKAWKTLC